MSTPRGLKLGVIGLGSMGKHHARIATTIPGATLVAVSDVNQEVGQAIAQQYKAEYFENFVDLLPLVDAVCLVTPTQTHFEFGKTIINAGKHLLIEKPLAKFAAEAKELVELAKEKNIILAVGHVERFNPAYQELKRLVRKEKIMGLNISRLSLFPARISDANVIQDMMIHDLDLLLDLLPNDEVESIKATGKKVKTKNLDTVEAVIYFRSGLIAKVIADRVFGSVTRKIVAITNNGMIEADLLNKQVYVRDLTNPVPSAHHVKQEDQLTAELINFVKTVKGKANILVNGEAGYQALQLAEEVEKACS